METVSESEVQALQSEVNRLQQEIAELKTIHSENTYMQLQRSRCPAMENRYVPNVSLNKELPFTSAVLRQMLAVNDDLNGITFSSVQKTKVTSDVYEVDVECKSYNLLFHVSCHLMTELDESITVKALKITFQDPSLVKEIMPFVNTCHREKNLQELLSGLAHYAALCNTRETVIRWLCNDHSSALQVTYSVDNGKYVIEIFGYENRELYLSCTWNIDWQKRNHMMIPFLEISVNRDDLPLERRRHIQRMCAKPPYDAEDMKEAWEEIIDCLEKLE